MNLLSGRFLFSQHGSALYCMSAPFGRVVDRHIKLFRYRTHPVVASGEKLKEPLLHLVASKGGGRQKRPTSRKKVNLR